MAERNRRKIKDEKEKTDMLKKNIMTIAAAFVMAVVMIGGISSETAFAVTKFDLPTGAVTYRVERDKDGNIVDHNNFVKIFTETFKYDKKGYLKKYASRYMPGSIVDGSETVETVKWGKTKGRQKKRVTTLTYTSASSSDRTTRTDYYNTKGLITKTQIVTKGSGKKATVTYKNNKKGWTTQSEYDGRSTKIKSLSFYKNGMPKKFTRVVPPVVAQFQKASKISYKFNKKGLLKEEHNKTFGTPMFYSYEYDKKGRVTVCWIKEKVKGTYVTTQKIVYTYGKSKTSDKRSYFGVMNRRCGASFISCGFVTHVMTTID